MVSCLATLPNLNTFIIKFKLSTSRPRLTSPPPPAHDVLPSLTHFDFTGSGKYLEDLVVRINDPLLHHIIVAFSVDFNFVASQLVQFISHKEILRTCPYVESDHLLVMMCNDLEGYLELGIRYSESRWRLRSLEWLCNNLLPLLFQMELLRICEDSGYPVHPAADMAPTQWRNVFLPFAAAYYLSTSRKMASIVVNSLGEPAKDDHEGVFPELCCMGVGFLYPSVCNKKGLDDFISDCRQYANRNIVILRGGQH